jgi:hypothetical protein
MRSKIPSACVLGVLAAAGVAGASEAGELSLPALAQQAARIFVGTAREIRYERDPRTGALQTRISFTGVEILKGPGIERGAPRQLSLRVAGGRDADGSYVQAAGTPRFHPGERYVLFQSASPAGSSPLVAGDQGCFRLARRGDGSRVVLDTGDRPVVAVRGGRILRPRPEASLERHDLFGATLPRAGDGGSVPSEGSDPFGAPPTLTRYTGSAAARFTAPPPRTTHGAMPAAAFLAAVRRVVAATGKARIRGERQGEEEARGWHDRRFPGTRCATSIR